jgi:hypothetical protein
LISNTHNYQNLTKQLNSNLTSVTKTVMAPHIEAVSTKSAPAPLPQFSQAVKHNGMVYCSGNIGAIPGTNFELVEGTVKDRAVGLWIGDSVAMCDD